MLSAIPLWLHLLAAATWVGSQVMMFLVVVPSVRLVDEMGTRQRVLRSVTTRFGYLGFASLLLLVLTGLDNMSRYSPDDMFDLRYGYILSTKIGLLVVVVLLTGYHALLVGPRLLALQGAGEEDAAALRGWRLRSIAASAGTLLLSLGILFCAALLRSNYAYG